MMSLPILSSRFFKEHMPQVGFFSKWASLYAWNERILPIYQWDDVLYIGCLVPPTNLPRMGSLKVVCVLCEPGALQDLWLEYQSSPSMPAPVMESKIPSLPDTEELDLNLDFSNEKTRVQASASPLEPLNLDDLSSPLESQLPSLDDAFPPPPADELLTLDDTETLALEDGSPKKEEEADDMGGLLDLTIGTEESKSSSQSSTPLVSLQPLKPLGATSQDSPVNLQAEKSEPIEDAPSVLSENTRATPTKSEVLMTSEVTRIAQVALLSTPEEKLDDWMTKIFEDMGKTFLKSMILLKKGDKLKAWKWDEHFTSTIPDTPGISLIQPSPFRIAARTKKPYHGYVVPSDTATKFFAEWNNSIFPEHLTIAPILVNDHVIGMLLATGTKASQTKEGLQMAESFAASIAQHISEQPRKASPAA